MKSEKAQSLFEKNTTSPSFGEIPNKRDELTPEQAKALDAQRKELKNTIAHITEKDINFSVTCMGHRQTAGNTRTISDYRVQMQSHQGYHWAAEFKSPAIIRNENLDERKNGESTAIVFPLNPKSQGFRPGDNMTMVLNGNISRPVLMELVSHMSQAGILSENSSQNVQYFVNSEYPDQFMKNPKIKTIIADFFKQKELEQARSTSTAQKTNDSKKCYNLKVSDINISEIDCKQYEKNKRAVKDYVRDFLKNGKKTTVIYDKYTENNREKDMTVILIPSSESDWDCVTVTIDKKISEDECRNFLNRLIEKNITSVDNETFRNIIVEFLNSL